MKTILFIGIFLSTALPGPVSAEEGEERKAKWSGKEPENQETQENKGEYRYVEPTDPVPNIEFISARVGGGLYGFGGDAGIITLRWKYVYWDIFRINIYFGGPPRGETLFRDHAGFFTALGYPFSNGNHEVRVGGGIGYQTFLSGSYKKEGLKTGLNQNGN